MPEEISAMSFVKLSVCHLSKLVRVGAMGLAIATLGAPLVASVGSTVARAADLEHRSLPNDRYRSAYEDPRYADLYAPAPPPPVVQHHSYNHAPIPRERVYRDDPSHGHEDLPPPHRTYTYQPYPPQAPRYAERPGCASPRAVERALQQDGWRDFSSPTLRGEDAFLNARRPDGRPFELRVDRCTGELVSAKPIDPRPYGPHVYGGRDAPRAY
jgi:hypothetical protein